MARRQMTVRVKILLPTVNDVVIDVAEDAPKDFIVISGKVAAGQENLTAATLNDEMNDLDFTFIARAARAKLIEPTE